MNQATTQPMPEITATELKQRLDNGEDIQIIDVREADEVAIATIPNSVHIPLGQVMARASEIDPNRETVVHCKMGGRSAKAIEALKRSGCLLALECCLLQSGATDETFAETNPGILNPAER